MRVWSILWSCFGFIAGSGVRRTGRIRSTGGSYDRRPYSFQESGKGSGLYWRGHGQGQMTGETGKGGQRPVHFLSQARRAVGRAGRAATRVGINGRSRDIVPGGKGTERSYLRSSAKWSSRFRRHPDTNKIENRVETGRRREPVFFYRRAAIH